MRLTTRTWGTEGDPVCVLLHGITSNAGSWITAGPALAGLGLHVLAPELRGHGDSPRGESYSTQELIDDLVETVPATQALLVGHSFGGYLAQRAVLDGALTPAALLLEDPVSHQPNAEVPTAMLRADRTGIPRSIDGILEREPRWSRLDAAWKVLSLEQVDWEGAESAFAGNAPWDLRPDAELVATGRPTLWLVPEESRFVPAEDVASLANTVGDARLVIAAKSGHSVHRDRLDLFMSSARRLLQESEVTP